MVPRQRNKLHVGDVLISKYGLQLLGQQHHLQKVLLMRKLFLDQVCELHALVK